MMRKSYHILLLIILSINLACANSIQRVYHTPEVFNPNKNESVSVYYTLESAADVALNIYDDRDFLIRTIVRKNAEAGNNVQVWDGKDVKGRVVPPEAYHYTIVLQNNPGKVIEHDLSDHTGNKRLKVKSFTWGDDRKSYEYILTRSARILTRVGIDNQGPLLVTLLNWAPRASGKHVETWDGKDASHVIDISDHPNIIVDMRSYSLSDNTILVGPETNRSEFIDIAWPKQKREVKKIVRKRMMAAQQQDPLTRGDYKAQISIVGDIAYNDENSPIVSGVVPILLSMDDKNMVNALRERVEPVFYVDGKYSFENEVGFLPMTWMFDTTKFNNGKHYVTVNVRGYEGNFGISTMALIIKNKQDD